MISFTRTASCGGLCSISELLAFRSILSSIWIRSNCLGFYLSLNIMWVEVESELVEESVWNRSLSRSCLIWVAEVRPFLLSSAWSPKRCAFRVSRAPACLAAWCSRDPSWSRISPMMWQMKSWRATRWRLAVLRHWRLLAVNPPMPPS